MNKKNIVVGISTVLLLSAISIPLGYAYSDDSTVTESTYTERNDLQNIQDIQLQTDQDIAKLAEMGITIDEPSSAINKLATDVITKDEAIEFASRYAPLFADTAKLIKAEYVLMTNPDFNLFSDEALNKNDALRQNKHLNKTPIYLVSFEGITKKGHDGFGGKEPTNFTEQNVVVDAISGEILYSFNYR